ncbi:hypothetical protein HYY75_12115 [bacterium]|nr:hypothetical protein [bacterium]
MFEGWNALFQEIFEKLNANFLEQVSFLVASMAKDVKFSSNEINPSSYLQEFFDRKIAEIKMFGQNFPQEFSEIQGMESKTPIKQQRLKPRQK